MTFISEDHNVLKSDEKGRVRMPAERREALLDEFERSGLSGVKFAALVGVKYPTFALWVQKRRRLRAQAAEEAPARGAAAAPAASPRPIRLLEAFGEVGGRSAAMAGLTIDLPGGARVRVESPSQLQLAVEALAAFGRERRAVMLSFTGGLKVFVALEPCDLRKSFNGLYALVTQRLGEDPRQGALFVFTNRPRTRLKILYWDGSGLWVLIKRLERGTFAWPKSSQMEGVKLKLAPEALAMLTDGIDLRGARLRPWYERE